ncbi:MAG: aminoacyl-tRNA hydrolase [Candidatus Rifleibacteriota bacterium]
MIIAGLGNPGEKYQSTRHNAGFWAVDSVAQKFRGSFDHKAHQSLICNFQFHGDKHLLIKPQTYMNLSGEALAGILLETDTNPDNLLVITDDINLPTGRIRLRASGSDGGHNGLKSIINHLGKGFWRLRIGVGQPRDEDESGHSILVDHVLGSITEEEEKIFEDIVQEIPDICALWLMGMGNKAMTRYNGFNFKKSPEDLKGSDK